ncbi:hypothetical protein IMSHALPRED_005743 [Imshaugia aleurites]|uniref:RING-type domain-containing protein n=1 Tax=Imshaugia aleurites TaxID=172621 RepID=A0A8H3FKN5_9LECA|nr:hypothetical protein IMSHALPRED_005743 [Imshaugia aleurites]
MKLALRTTKSLPNARGLEPPTAVHRRFQQHHHLPDAPRRVLQNQDHVIVKCPIAMQMAASGTLIEALQKSRSELLEEKERRTAKTKGKAKATERDEEEEAEFRRRIKEYDDALSDVQGAGPRSPDYATCDPGIGPRAGSTRSGSGFVVAEEDEPVWNPLTNSYAYRETGFEPGPSGLGAHSRPHQQGIKVEHETSRDAGLDDDSNFAGSSPVWTQYAEQPQRKILSHIPEEPTEVYAMETLRTDPAASTARRDAAIENVDWGKWGEDLSSQVPHGRFAYMGKVVRSWMAPGLRRWLFGAKSSDDATHQASPDRMKTHSRLGSGSSNSAVTYFGPGSSSASPTFTNTPRSSLSSGSSTWRILRGLQGGLNHPRSPSDSDGASECAKLPAASASPGSAPSMSSRECEPSSSSGTSFSGISRQSLSEPLLPHPQTAQPQQQQRLEQGWDTPGQHERETRQAEPEDETMLLALSLEEEDRAGEERYGLSQRVAMRLQSEEDREAAERQEVLEKEWLREELRLEAELESERRAAAEVERLRQEHRAQEATFRADRKLAARLSDSNRAILSDRRYAEQLRAQEAALQADRELAARLSDSDRWIQSDREYAEQLQAEMAREDANEFPIPGGWEQESRSGPTHGRSPTDRVQNRTQQSQPRASDDRAFALRLHEEEKKRSAREEEQTRAAISAWQKKTEQHADRPYERWGTSPPKAHAAPQGRTIQADQAQATRGSQAAQNARTAANDPGDKGECVSCTDSFPKTQLVRPCEHFYCRACLAGKAIPLPLHGHSSTRTN